MGHILLKKPVESSSYYFNYKGAFSIVLLALVDADYKFIYIEVGCKGAVSDGGVFWNSSLSTAISENILIFLVKVGYFKISYYHMLLLLTTHSL